MIKKLFQKKLIKRVAWLVAIFLTLAVLFHAIENFRGAKVLKEVLVTVDAAGETVEFDDLLPELVPDEENFGAIPLLKDLALVTDGDSAAGSGGAARKRIEDYGKLILGDAGKAPKFHEFSSEAPIKAVQGKFGTPNYLADIQLKDKNGMRWTYYWSWADQYSRFDFIFLNKGILPEVDQDKSYIHSAPSWFTASDHRPCVAKIKPVDK